MGKLQKPQPFQRRDRRLPGQSSDEGLGLDRVSFIERPAATVFERELIQIGNMGAGQYVQIDVDGVKLYANSQLHIDLQADGDLFIGEDVSSAAGTYLAVFAEGQTYNGESMAAGDMLIGDNSSGKANILWDRSEGRLKFRGGSTVGVYIDTDGSLAAGGGDVILDGNGLTIAAGQTGATKRLKMVDGSSTVGQIYTYVSGGFGSILQLSGTGKDSGSPEGFFSLAALTYDGTAHGGSAAVNVEGDTMNDLVTLSAGEVRIEGGVTRHIGLTTAERDAISAADGMVIYNRTTDKFQGRAGGAWVDLH